jgi:transposase
LVQAKKFLLLARNFSKPKTPLRATRQGSRSTLIFSAGTIPALRRRCAPTVGAWLGSGCLSQHRRPQQLAACGLDRHRRRQRAAESQLTITVDAEAGVELELAPGAEESEKCSHADLQLPRSTTLECFRSETGEYEVQVPTKRPPYPEEFHREATRLAQLGDEPQRRLAKDWGISDVTSRNWLKEDKAARGERPGGLSGDEREELQRLRDEMEREILRKAAVFFAREDDRR